MKFFLVCMPFVSLFLCVDCAHDNIYFYHSVVPSHSLNIFSFVLFLSELYSFFLILVCWCWMIGLSFYTHDVVLPLVLLRMTCACKIQHLVLSLIYSCVEQNTLLGILLLSILLDSFFSSCHIFIWFGLYIFECIVARSFLASLLLLQPFFL